MTSVYMQAPDGSIFETSNSHMHNDCKKLKKSEGEKLYKLQEKEYLLKHIKPNDTIYCNIASVSSSGMTRTIKLFIIDVDSDGKNFLRDITRLASVIIGWKQSSKTGGLIVTGCGMDMVFHTVYTLGAILWENGTLVQHGTRNGEPDFAGGYALKHSVI